MSDRLINIAKEANSRGEYVVYAIASRGDKPSGIARTYCGSTNNIVRRLRQHNGELSGGARCTKAGRPWFLVAIVSGRLDKRRALRCEFLSKEKHNKRLKLPTDRLKKRVFMMERASRMTPKSKLYLGPELS